MHAIVLFSCISFWGIANPLTKQKRIFCLKSRDYCSELPKYLNKSSRSTKSFLPVNTQRILPLLQRVRTQLGVTAVFGSSAFISAIVSVKVLILGMVIFLLLISIFRFDFLNYFDFSSVFWEIKIDLSSEFICGFWFSRLIFDFAKIRAILRPRRIRRSPRDLTPLGGGNPYKPRIIRHSRHNAICLKWR